MISLVYEEYCLREDQGESLDPEQFCDRYPAWRDSLLSQLRYHQAFSRMVSTPVVPTWFPEPGETFLGYQLCSELGRGGVGRVYLARDEKLGGRRLALKVSPDRGDEPSIQGRLDHPHIVPVTHVDRHPETGLRGLCMPFLPGRSLDEVITRINPVRSRPRRADALRAALGAGDTHADEAEANDGPGWADFPHAGTYADAAAWVALKLAEALAHAHSRKIIHRDIKPANILLTHRGGPLLLDFNLAQAPCDAEEAEEANRGGTLPYMAPEQLRAFLDPDHWDEVGPTCDLYALGLVLRELLTGHRPPTPDRALPTPRQVNDLLDLRRAEALRSVRRIDPTVPHALDAIVAKCLEPVPARRYHDANALAEDLRRYLARRPLLQAINPSRTERLRFSIRRNRRILALIALCLLIAAPASLGTFALKPAPKLTANELLELSTFSIRNGDHQAASRYFRELEGRFPEQLASLSAEYLVNLGTIRLQESRFPSARDCFLRALQQNPNLYEAHQGLGVVNLTLKEFATGERHYAEAVRLARSEDLTTSDFATLLRDRAINLCAWGWTAHERLIGEPGSPTRQDDTDTATARYGLALELLDEARRRLRNRDGKNSELVLSVLYHTARARTWLGHVADLSGDPDAARASYRIARQEARDALSQAQTITNADLSAYEDSLRRLVEEADAGLTQIGEVVVSHAN